MEALDYLKKIEKAGYEAYIVGGYVRDYLLNIPSTDIDIASIATPKTICKIFNITSLDNLGCINIKSSKHNVDITTYRKESNYFNHRPKTVVYVKDLLTDLKRRDFTINTICMNSEGKIIDLLEGQKDLKAKTLKVVGKVKKKFTEDPLRMLRALRLAIIYDLNINDEELIFILNNKTLFSKISYERKKNELGKILISKNCIKGLNLLKNLNLLEVLEIDYNDDIVYVPDYIGMWSQLNYSHKYPFSKIEHMRLSNIKNIISSKKVDAKSIFRYGIYDNLVAGTILGINKRKITDINGKMQIHSTDELAISGKEIKYLLQIDNSPLIRDIKKELIINILDNKLTNDNDSLREYILKNWK